MTSKQEYQEAYVWIWLPDETKPTVAGRLEPTARSYISTMVRVILSA